MKKKVTLICSLLITSLFVNAQSNLNLDIWTNNQTAENWNALLNSFADLVGDTSVVQTTGTSGSAAKLKPVDLSALGLSGYYASFFQYGLDGKGQPYTKQLDSVFFQFKQVTGAGIATQLQFCITKFNANTSAPDTIATAMAQLASQTNDFEAQKMEFVYNSAYANLTPDSIKIMAVLAGSDPSVVGTAYAVIDEIVLKAKDGSTNVISTIAKDNEISVYPTLTGASVNFNFGKAEVASITITDITGKIVRSSYINGLSNFSMNVSDMQNGMYIYSILDKNAATVKSGKFVVVK